MSRWSFFSGQTGAFRFGQLECQQIGIPTIDHATAWMKGPSILRKIEQAANVEVEENCCDCFLLALGAVEQRESLLKRQPSIRMEYLSRLVLGT